MIVKLLATVSMVVGVAVPRAYPMLPVAPVPAIAYAPDAIDRVPGVTVHFVPLPPLDRIPEASPVPVAAVAPIPEPSPAEIAVSTALAQVGKWYQWGANGPDVFDCSGLMQFAWTAAGVDMPHSTYSQWRSLPHVSIDEMQPGDLIFTSNLGHVYMYIGDGQVVQAQGSRTRVKISPVPTRGIRQEVVRPA